MRPLLFLFFSIQLFGVMAFSNWQTFHQDDGTSFEAKVQGDEYFHWIETKDGTLLIFNQAANRYEYLELNATDAFTSHQKYQPSQPSYSAQFRASKNYTKQSELLQKIWKKRRNDYAALRQKRAQAQQ